MKREKKTMKNKTLILLACSTTIAFGALGTVFAKTEVGKEHFQNLTEYVGENFLPEEQVSVEEVKKELERGKNLPPEKENYDTFITIIQKYHSLPKEEFGEPWTSDAKYIEDTLDQLDQEAAKKVEEQIQTLFTKEKKEAKEILEVEEAIRSLNGSQESLLDGRYGEKMDQIRSWGDEIRESGKESF